MFSSCVSCYSTLVDVWRSIIVQIWNWVSARWQECRRASCDWWCLCCNKWLCWIVLIIILVVVFIVWLIIEVVVVVLCTLVLIWCVLCRVICWIGCLGNQGCVDNCVNNCPDFSFEVDWDPPLGSDTDSLGSGTDTGTGTSTWRL